MLNDPQRTDGLLELLVWGARLVAFVSLVSVVAAIVAVVLDARARRRHERAMRETLDATAQTGSLTGPTGGTCCGCGYAGPEETTCPTRQDGVHCSHWWDGDGRYEWRSDRGDRTEAAAPPASGIR